MAARVRPRVLRVHRVISYGLFLGVLVQIYAAGLMFYGVQEVHRTLGWLLIATALIAVPIGAWATGWQREAKLSLVLAGLLFLQPIFVFVLAGISPFLGGLHALSGGAALLVLFVMVRSRGATARRR